ncbi:hypothetical protein LBMAG56_03470 [Verrucomicrobiota bacterium]|nr:hypothetical protein LBMAG56_03470 [Verrucomicrobiota bacterium]
MFDKFFNRPPGGKAIKKAAANPAADAPKTGAAPAAATPPAPDVAKLPTAPAPAPSPPAAVSSAPAKVEEKPDSKGPNEAIPDIKTLKIDRSLPREKPKMPDGSAAPEAAREAAKSPADSALKTPSPNTLTPLNRPAESATPAAAPSRPASVPQASPPASSGGVSPPEPISAARPPSPLASEKTDSTSAQDPVKPSPLPAPTAPVALLTAPKKADAPASTLPPVPAPKPTEPPAPKAAQFQNLPATDAWCPPAIAEHYPELRAHIYEDNAATERVLPGGWRIVGATKRGRQHAHKATHREDALAFNVGAQFTILCVSDGAGSCPLSRLGSHVASHTVAARLMEQLPKLEKAVTDDADKLKTELSAQLTAALVAACQALVDMAAKTKTSAKDYRCTLLTLLHWRGEKHELLIANQIGDGAILVLNQDKSTRRIGEADSGQFSGEVSCFVPDDNARDKAKKIDFIAPADAVECVLLCTDGLEDPFFPIAKKAGDLFRQLYAGVSEPLKDFKAQPPQPPILPQESAAGALGQWLEFEKRGENDDRTVLLLHRRPPTVTF